MGQLSVACCQFTSDTPLTSEVVKFNPALFVSSTTQVPSNNIQNQWFALYPAIGSTIDMTWGGSAVNQNWQSTIEALDEYNFIICLEFFWLSDINNFTNDASYNNFQIFNNVVGSGTSVYQQQQYLAMNVTVNGDSANCFQPAEGNTFCEDNVVFTLGELDGFCPGDDLKIDISFPKTDSGIGNNFYVGFIQTNNITNALPYVNDYSLSYGLVNNGVSQVPTIGQSTLDISCFADGEGFISNSLNTTGSVTVSGSCLKANSKYKIYIVYKKNGEWKSCLSQPICQKQDEGLPDVEGIGECCVTDSLGNQYNDCCVRGLAPCGKTIVCIKLPRAGFEAALSAEGYDLPMEEYLVSSYISISNSDPSISGIGGVGSLSSVPTINSDGIELCRGYTAEITETKYFTGCFRFNYGTNLIPIYQNIYIVTEIGFTGESVLANPIFTLNGENIQESYCCEIDGVLGVDIGQSDCTGFLSNSGSTYSEIGDISAIDTELLECDNEYCVKAICSDGSTTDPTDECECPECANSLDVTVIQNTCAQNSNSLNISVAGGVVTGGTLQWAEVIGSTIVATGFQGVSSNSITANLPVTSTAANAIFVYILDLTLDNRCEYRLNTGQIISEREDGSLNCVTNQIFTATAITTTQLECDCPEECEDINTGYVEYECDPENGITSCQSVVNLTSSVDTDTGDQKTEELDSDGNVIKCTISREITFTNGCAPLHIEDVIECIINDPCINTRILKHEISDDCKLKITITDTFDSDILSDKLIIIKNGVRTEYDQINNAYTNDCDVCHSDSIQYWTETIFNDGCVDLIKPTTSFQVNQPQKNTRAITCEVVNGLIELTITDNFVDTVSSDTLYIEVNGNLNTYDQISNPYSNDLTINEGDQICAWSQTEFEPCCTPPLALEKVCKNVTVTPSDCDYSGYGLSCEYTQGLVNEDGTCELGQFAVNQTNGAATLIKDITLWCFNDKPFVYDSDGNVRQNGIPYLKPVVGDGQFYVGRCIQIQGCDPIVLWDYCSSIPLSNVNVKGANFDLSEMPPLKIDGYVKTIDCTESVNSGEDTTVNK